MNTSFGGLVLGGLVQEVEVRPEKGL